MSTLERAITIAAKAAYHITFQPGFFIPTDLAPKCPAPYPHISAATSRLNRPFCHPQDEQKINNGCFVPPYVGKKNYFPEPPV